MIDNELIAQFMGFRLDGVEYEHRFAHHPDKGAMLINRMKYHESWDWLMPVVEKIEKLDAYGYDTSLGTFSNEYLFTITRGTANGDGGEFFRVIVEKEGSNKIDTVYQAVVEFIKWYNTQNTIKPFEGDQGATMGKSF